MEYFLQAFNKPVLKKDEIKFAPMNGMEDKPARGKTRKARKPRSHGR
ncbi:MAG: hypothetical protein HY756_04035 [Nitrospirae bacterium]|nr:hypothetical protein [Nitrospirota bacterium]